MRTAGPEALSLRSLASSQGTSTTAIYTMFGGKAGLLATVAAEVDHDLAAAQREALGARGPLEDLRSIARAYRHWALDNSGLYGLIIAERSAPFTVLLEVVDALIDEQVFRDSDVQDVAASIWASIHGVIALELTAWAGATSAETYFEMQLSAIIRSWLRTTRSGEVAGTGTHG